jgi:hypothetical protein
MRNTLVLIRWLRRACGEAALAMKFVHRRSMGDMCVVDFPSLLLIPMLERIAQG